MHKAAGLYKAIKFRVGCVIFWNGRVDQKPGNDGIVDCNC